jgi:rhodanese-related sulfurtransferase
MTRTTLAAILAAGALFITACGGSDTAVIETVPATEAAEILAEPPTGLVTLDVRTPEEFDEVRIAGSSNLDFYAPDFDDRLDALDKTLPYFVYCRSGNRSGQALDTMRELGFEEVYNLDGGIVAWNEAGFPVEQ